jgi:hypothetical protein
MKRIVSLLGGPADRGGCAHLTAVPQTKRAEHKQVQQIGTYKVLGRDIYSSEHMRRQDPNRVPVVYSVQRKQLTKHARIGAPCVRCSCGSRDECAAVQKSYWNLQAAGCNGLGTAAATQAGWSHPQASQTLREGCMRVFLIPSES